MAPSISVLYTTFNRAPFLCRSLESMTCQTLPQDRFEVVVVDDGSDDDTAAVVTAFADRLPLVHVHQENAGVAQGKNHALALARGDIVVFMDDDDLAEPDLLTRHLDAHKRHPNDHFAVLGHTRLAPEVAAQPLMNYVSSVGNQMFAYTDLRHGERLDYTYFWGGRSSCKARFLETHGRFDPAFRFGSEDIELGYRLSKHGLQVIYDAHAVSVMMRAMELETYARRIYAQGRSNWLFAKKHPTGAVRRFCGVDTLQRDWQAIRDRLPLYQRTAIAIEAIYRSRYDAGFEPADTLVWLLHHHYDLVLEGYRLKGSWDASQAT